MNPAAAIGSLLGFGRQVSQNATSGYSENYATKQRSNVELFIILSLFILASMGALIWLFKSAKK